MYQRFASNMPLIIIKIPGGEYLRRRESQTVGSLHLPDLVAFDGLRDRAHVSMIRSPLRCLVRFGSTDITELGPFIFVSTWIGGKVGLCHAHVRFEDTTREQLSLCPTILRVPLQGTTLLMWQVLDASMQAIFCSPNPSRLLAGRTF